MRALVKEYVKYYVFGNDLKWESFVRSKRRISDQIETAILSVDTNGIMHGHQRRVGSKRLKRYAEAMLLEEMIVKIKKAILTGDFHAVYLLFKDETENHYMVSKLTAYDATQRLCSAHDILPEYIYLHAGTTVGAKNLGINTKGKEYLALGDIPKWISSELGANHIENFLCIYKASFLSKRKVDAADCEPPRRRKKVIC